MMTPTSRLCLLLVRELHGFIREIEMFPDDTLMWDAAPGVTNSAANLALHVAGNLKHYIGHVLGGIDYVRDRTLEFGRRSGTRAEVVAELRSALEVVQDVMPRLTDETLSSSYPEGFGRDRIETMLFLHHLNAHIAFHLGQAGYVRRIVTGENRSAGPVPLTALAAPA